MNQPVLACAHRGLSAEQPENTIAAFQAAANAGAHVIELDVRLSNDGHAVVMHDASIARTTDGSARVNDLDLVELQTHQTADGPIPTLDEIFAVMHDWSGVWNVEIKDTGATGPTLDSIESAKLGNRCLVTSMDPAALRIASERAPQVGRGLIVLGKPDQEDLEVATEHGCQWLMVDHEQLTMEQISAFSGNGFKVGAWTVNDVDEALSLHAAGSDMIITDRRDVLTALIG